MNAFTGLTGVLLIFSVGFEIAGFFLEHSAI